MRFPMYFATARTFSAGVSLRVNMENLRVGAADGAGTLTDSTRFGVVWRSRADLQLTAPFAELFGHGVRERAAGSERRRLALAIAVTIAIAIAARSARPPAAWLAPRLAPAFARVASVARLAPFARLACRGTRWRRL